VGLAETFRAQAEAIDVSSAALERSNGLLAQQLELAGRVVDKMGDLQGTGPLFPKDRDQGGQGGRSPDTSGVRAGIGKSTYAPGTILGANGAPLDPLPPPRRDEFGRLLIPYYGPDGSIQWSISQFGGTAGGGGGATGTAPAVPGSPSPSSPPVAPGPASTAPPPDQGLPPVTRDALGRTLTPYRDAAGNIQYTVSRFGGTGAATGQGTAGGGTPAPAVPPSSAPPPDQGLPAPVRDPVTGRTLTPIRGEDGKIHWTLGQFGVAPPTSEGSSGGSVNPGRGGTDFGVVVSGSPTGRNADGTARFGSPSTAAPVSTPAPTGPTPGERLLAGVTRDLGKAIGVLSQKLAANDGGLSLRTRGLAP
jgi:hypothetical protein